MLILAALVLGLQAPDTCLSFVSRNLAKGNGNFFTYVQFSSKQLRVKGGDVLSYEVFLDPKNPIAKGGLDVEFDQGAPLRDRGIIDQNGLRAHGDGLLKEAVGKWYSRRIPMEKMAGRTCTEWNLVFEGDDTGRYVEFIDNVTVEHADGTKTPIYENGPPDMREVGGLSGYSNKPSLHRVQRSAIKEGASIEPAISATILSAQRLRRVDGADKDLKFVANFLKQHPDPEIEGHLQEARTALAALMDKDTVTAEEIENVLHTVQHTVQHAHPMMSKYTGHLVGHAHIDLQWLWEWQEGIVATHDTFVQAVKFMDEFPGFTFSQSSSCLYQVVEDTYPDLFKKLQAKVKSGQWELVGGRVCEGDTNMISPESSARQFLYGQSYFREKFGKTAVVGWEPDTFGHNAQMPQILKLGGCNYYYFCRGGKGKPLFWWKGLDGTKILTFDEPASGSWYNADISYKQFQEMLDFEKNAGSKDSLWVYGVGNHGGGPTREHIQTALEMMKSGSLPSVKFSTATQFFKKLETYDLTKIPIISQELNPVFDGCYTTHSDVKQLNRDAESWTTSAEAAATAASYFGFRYPRAAFRRNWEDICFNHHHDTLPGSGIHAPYERTKTTLGRVIADDKDIVTRALELMTTRVTPTSQGGSVLVFNPLGWSRSGWVETYLVQSGWSGGERLNPERCAAFDPAGGKSQVVLLDKISRKARFWAPNIPSFGYRVFNIKNADPVTPEITLSEDGMRVETDRMAVTFDPATGEIEKLKEKATDRMTGRMGRMEFHYEKPGGMTAWVIQPIARVDAIKPVSHSVTRGPGFADVSFRYERASLGRPEMPTTIVQTYHIEKGAGMVTCKVVCDWHNVGSDSTDNPMLRVAFDTGIANADINYDIPFGTLQRPADGKESPALKWADASDSSFGVSILNDSKHGYSASEGALRLTLIRSSYDPDPEPNPGLHEWRYAIYPHAGGWAQSGVVKNGYEFNQPLLSATVPFDALGKAPLEWSAVKVSGATATCLKRAEKDGDLIVRYYESTGKPSTGFLEFPKPIVGASLTSFLEDPLSKAQISGNRSAIRLHGFEIQTVKARLAP